MSSPRPKAANTLTDECLALYRKTVAEHSKHKYIQGIELSFQVLSDLCDRRDIAGMLTLIYAYDAQKNHMEACDALYRKAVTDYSKIRYVPGIDVSFELLSSLCDKRDLAGMQSMMATYEAQVAAKMQQQKELAASQTYLNYSSSSVVSGKNVFNESKSDNGEFELVSLAKSNNATSASTPEIRNMRR